MSNIKIKLNSAGVRALLRSAEMGNRCAEKAAEIRQYCGEGYEMDKYTGSGRVNAMVWAATPEAKRDNLEHNTILKATRRAVEV